MRKILPILLAVIVLAAAAHLSPLYPVYAQDMPPAPTTTTREASAPAGLRPIKKLERTVGKMEQHNEGMMMRDKIASREAELREKLAKFKDKAKATRTENITGNLNSINKRWTTAMTQNLTRMSEILEKLKAKAQAAESAGKDVTELKSAIAKVDTEWAEADAALKAQTENDYTVVVNSESTVSADAKAARNSLQADLKTTHTQISEAREALGSAIQAAMNSLGGGQNGQ